MSRCVIGGTRCEAIECLRRGFDLGPHGLSSLRITVSPIPSQEVSGGRCLLERRPGVLSQIARSRTSMTASPRNHSQGRATQRWNH